MEITSDQVSQLLGPALIRWEQVRKATMQPQWADKPGQKTEEEKYLDELQAEEDGEDAIDPVPEVITRGIGPNGGFA